MQIKLSVPRNPNTKSKCNTCKYDTYITEPTLISCKLKSISVPSDYVVDCEGFEMDYSKLPKLDIYKNYCQELKFKVGDILYFNTYYTNKNSNLNEGLITKVKISSINTVYMTDVECESLIGTEQKIVIERIYNTISRYEILHTSLYNISTILSNNLLDLFSSRIKASDLLKDITIEENNIKY